MPGTKTLSIDGAVAKLRSDFYESDFPHRALRAREIVHELPFPLMLRLCHMDHQGGMAYYRDEARKAVATGASLSDNIFAAAALIQLMLEDSASAR